MSKMLGSKSPLIVATVLVAAIVIGAFFLLPPVFDGQESTSSISSTTSAVSTSSSTATSNTSSSAEVMTSRTITTTSSATTTTTVTTGGHTTSTTTRTFNSTNSIVIPFGVGENESQNFQPSSIVVVIGVNNTIVWTDMDAEQHTVVSMSVPQGAAKFDSGILNQGQTFTLRFTVPGVYKYYCTIHPTWMRGTITVLNSPP
jgi:plastocyanin